MWNFLTNAFIFKQIRVGHKNAIFRDIRGNDIEKLLTIVYLIFTQRLISQFRSRNNSQVPMFKPIYRDVFFITAVNLYFRCERPKMTIFTSLEIYLWIIYNLFVFVDGSDDFLSSLSPSTSSPELKTSYKQVSAFDKYYYSECKHRFVFLWNI